MLKAMRKNVKKLSPSLWIVIAAFIIAIFAVWGGGGRLGEFGAEKPLVVIGKKKISSDEYLLALRRQLESLQAQFKDLNKDLIQQLGIPQRVLQELIQQSLLWQMAKELGLDVSEDELRDQIMSLPVFQREGKFIGFEEYRRLLQLNRLSLTEFETSLKKDILLEKIVKLLTANVTVLEQEAWENYKKNNESARIEYLVLENNKIAFEEKPTPEELKKYFTEHQENFKLPERRRGVLVFLSLSELAKEVTITDIDIEKYYQENKNQFKEPEKIKVSRIFLPFSSAEASNKEIILNQAASLMNRLKAGEDFASLAKEFSKDDKALQGGDWGEWEWRRLSSREQEEIQKLEKGADALVEIEEGVSILRVTEKEPERFRPLAEVRSQIKSTLEDQKARALGNTKLTELAKKAKKDKNLEAAAHKMGLASETVGPLTQGEGIPEKDPSGFISQALFKLKEKEISDTIATFEGVALCQLTSVERAHAATLDEVKEGVEKSWAESKRKQLAKEKLISLQPKLAEQKDWEEIARQYNLEYKTVNEHKREQYLSLIGDSPEVDHLLFSLPVGTISEPVAYEGGYAVFRVLTRKEVKYEDFLANRQNEIDNLLTAKKNNLLMAYLNLLQEEKKVRFNSEAFQKINDEILARFSR